MQKKSVWNTYNETQLTELEQLAKDYRNFLNVGKTERECVKETIRRTYSFSPETHFFCRR